MDRVRLSDERLRALVCPLGVSQAFLWDTLAPGLAVRVTPTAKAGEKRRKAFIFQGRYQGKPLRVTIGDAGVWDIADARAKAREMQQHIDNGRDPRLVKADAAAADAARREVEQRRAVLVGDAWTAYLEDRKPHWGSRHYADHEALAHAGGAPKKRGKGSTTAGPLSELMREKLSSLTSDRLEAWAAKESVSRPARARLGLRLVSGILAWCATRPEYKDAVHRDAAKSKRVREKLGNAERRQLVLQREELAVWFASVRGIPNLVIAVYLQFMLLNGPRPNEPLALKWEDVNFQRQQINIRDKVEGLRIIPLTPYTSYLLSSLPRRNQWVFSSPRSATGQLVDPGDAHDAACLAAGLPRITLQGLRRSFATLSEWVDIPAGVAAQIQGHKPQGVREQNYVRRPVDLLRVHHEKLEAWMLDQAGIQFKARKGLQVIGGTSSA
jgi:integrase